MATAHDAIVEPEDTRAYEGAPGQTRMQSIHLIAAHGSAVSRKVYRVVNVKTDPLLRELALDGELHRLADGRRLLMPFVYHDPDHRKFALVIPTELSHLEFKEWSALMSELAEDTSATVPRYVRDAMTVVGLSAFRRYAEVQPERDDQWLDEHGRELEEEDEFGPDKFPFLRDSSPPPDMSAIRRPRSQTATNDDTDREWQEVSSDELGSDDATIVASVSSLASQAEATHRNATEAAVRRTVSDNLPSPPENLSKPRTRSQRSSGEFAAQSQSPPDSTGPSKPRDRKRRSRSFGARMEVDSVPDVAPPGSFDPRQTHRMAARILDDNLWLFASLSSDQYATLGRNPELLLQCVLREGRPVVVLSLVSQRDGTPAGRIAFDGLGAMAKSLLTSLEAAYRAHLSLYVDGHYRETLDLASLREGVARVIIEYIEELPQGKALVDGDTAVEHVLRTPPPVDSDDLPFGPARRPMSTTKTVLHAVEQLQSWLRPERQREAMLIYSVPRHVMEASTRRVLRAAMSFGVALSHDAVAACMDLGVASSRAQLVDNQLTAFRARIQQGENDLDGSSTRRNWEELFVQAKQCGVPVGADISAFAAASHVPTILPPAAIDREEFSSASIDALTQMLEVAEDRGAAFRELCRRKDSKVLEALFACLEAAAPSEVALLAPHLSRFGEGLTDRVSQGLTSGNAQVRQASALLIGHLKLRRALSPLTKQLDDETSPTWPEMARALSDFGASALRGVSRALEKANHPERYAVTLGHLANRGCLREVESLESHQSIDVSRAARNALARRSRLQWEDLAVREHRTLPENSPGARFSQAFFAESAKLDI